MDVIRNLAVEESSSCKKQVCWLKSVGHFLMWNLFGHQQHTDVFENFIFYAITVSSIWNWNFFLACHIRIWSLSINVLFNTVNDASSVVRISPAIIVFGNTRRDFITRNMKDQLVFTIILLKT